MLHIYISFPVHVHHWPVIPNLFVFFCCVVSEQKTPLRMSGIYVKSVVPDSPAALNQRLRVGDRILAVNGISLVAMDYHR